MVSLYWLKRQLRTSGDRLLNLNLFDDGSRDLSTIHRQKLTTRLFLLLFGIAVIILLMYTSISEQTTIETVIRPGQMTFERLQIKYSQTLRCPCKQISTTYGRFVKTKPSLHQVCSSDFVSQSWIDFTFEIDREFLLPMDARNTLSNMWQMILGLCQSASNTIIHSLQEFANSPLVTYTAVSKTYLEVQVQAVLQDVQQTAIDTFLRDLTLITTTPYINGFLVGIRTNFVLYTVEPSSYTALPLLAVPVMNRPSANTTCYCNLAQSCPTPSGFYPLRISEQGLNDIYYDVPNVTIPGLVFDCTPSSMASFSTLECFYNQSCIDMLLTYYTRTFYVSVLNDTVSSRFPRETIVQNIIDQLFLEKIVNATSFDAYYNECDPMYCIYSYFSRFHLIFIFTTFISLIGGLNITLRLVTPYSIRIFMFLKRKFFRSNNDSQPSNCKTCI